METFDSLMAEYQSWVSDLEASYRNFQTARLLGTAEWQLGEMWNRLEAKEQYLKGLLDRINKACIDGICTTGES